LHSSRVVYDYAFYLADIREKEENEEEKELY